MAGSMTLDEICEDIRSLEPTDEWLARVNGRSGVIESSLNTEAPIVEYQLDVVTTECSYRTIPCAHRASVLAAMRLHRASPDVVSVKLLRRTVVVEEVAG